jgi:hypothetical protein
MFQRNTTPPSSGLKKQTAGLASCFCWFITSVTKLESVMFTQYKPEANTVHKESYLL